MALENRILHLPLLMNSNSKMTSEVKEEEENKQRRGEILLYYYYDTVDFYVLPEGCIAAVVSFTGPRDACRFSSISKLFKSAADSDAVWDRFLPSDYRDIISRSSDGSALSSSSLDSLSKKQLFMLLADSPLLIDGGYLSFSLDKSTGKKCFTIAARNLAITWGDTPKYWAWNAVPKSESRFSEVAELVTVCWLEIIGKMKISLLSPDTDYAAYLVFKLTSESYGFYNAAEVTVKTSGGKVETGDVYLDYREKYQIVPRRVGMFNRFRAPVRMPSVEAEVQAEDKAKLPKQRADGWLEIKIGNFSTSRDEEGEVEMSVLEVKAGNWKGGMRVEGIEIRPNSG